MSQNKQDKIQMQKKIQRSYRKIKQMRMEDMDHINDYSDMDDMDDRDNNKIGSIIIRICVVLGILVFLLNVFNKEF